MSEIKLGKTKAEVLAEISAVHDQRHTRSSELLANIKEHREEIASMLHWFKQGEPDLIYRYYHQSFKAFSMVEYIRTANKLFSDLAPELTFLNSWYVDITRSALSKKFDGGHTNQHWHETLLPVMQGFWHAKYFLEQMLVAADELDEAPQMLPSGWAAVLYLYDLR